MKGTGTTRGSSSRSPRGMGGGNSGGMTASRESSYMNSVAERGRSSIKELQATARQYGGSSTQYETLSAQRRQWVAEQQSAIKSNIEKNLNAINKATGANGTVRPAALDNWGRYETITNDGSRVSVSVTAGRDIGTYKSVTVYTSREGAASQGGFFESRDFGTVKEASDYAISEIKKHNRR